MPKATKSLLPQGIRVRRPKSSRSILLRPFCFKCRDRVRRGLVKQSSSHYILPPPPPSLRVAILLLRWKLRQKFGYTGKGYVANRNRIVGGMLVRTVLATCQVSGRSELSNVCAMCMVASDSPVLHKISVVALETCRRCLRICTASAPLLQCEASSAYLAGGSIVLFRGYFNINRDFILVRTQRNNLGACRHQVETSDNKISRK